MSKVTFTYSYLIETRENQEIYQERFTCVPVHLHKDR